LHDQLDREAGIYLGDDSKEAALRKTGNEKSFVYKCRREALTTFGLPQQ
jgi:hypothetical protein